MVKAAPGLFQVQLEGLCRYAVELGRPPLGIAPERLNAVDVASAPDEPVVTVADPKMFVIADANQAVAPPAVRMDPVPESTLPRAAACSVALAQLGTISV